MKHCNSCNQDKQECDFNFKYKEKNILHAKCKDCQHKYSRKHYKKNKATYIARSVRDRKKEREKTKNLLLSLKTRCSNCGECHPATLDFHHLDMSQKEDHIARIRSRKKIIEEAKKCIVLCSNCHRKVHYDMKHK